MTTFCLDNCLHPSRHAFYKVLACFWWNIIPFFYHPIPQLMHSLWWLWILLESLLQVQPEVFNGVDVWELSWPDHDINVVILKPLGYPFGGMFGVIVLLKCPRPLWHLQLFKTFHHSPIQNFTVLHSIHDPLNLCKHPYSIPPHTTQYYKIVPSSMLDCGSGSPVRKWFPPLLPSIGLSIWSNPVDFGLLWP